MNVPISSLDGFAAVRELIPDGYLHRFTDVRSLRIDNVIGRDGIFRKDLTLILTDALEQDGSAHIRISMRNISDVKLVNTSQITGLAVSDIRERQWDRKNYVVFDCEDSGFKLCCESIEITKVWRTKWASRKSG